MKLKHACGLAGALTLLLAGAAQADTCSQLVPTTHCVSHYRGTTLMVQRNVSFGGDGMVYGDDGSVGHFSCSYPDQVKVQYLLNDTDVLWFGTANAKSTKIKGYGRDQPGQLYRVESARGVCPPPPLDP